MRLSLVGGHDTEVLEWARARLETPIVGPYAAFGVVDDDGMLRGAAMFYNFFVGGNIEIAFVGPGLLTRPILRKLWHYAFTENKVARLTIRTMRGNLIMRRILPRLGFLLEGTQRRYFGPNRSDDALIFVLRRKDRPRWLGVVT